jgi:hypothetical protein
MIAATDSVEARSRNSLLLKASGCWCETSISLYTLNTVVSFRVLRRVCGRPCYMGLCALALADLGAWLETKTLYSSSFHKCLHHYRRCGVLPDVERWRVA